MRLDARGCVAAAMAEAEEGPHIEIGIAMCMERQWHVAFDAACAFEDDACSEYHDWADWTLAPPAVHPFDSVRLPLGGGPRGLAPYYHTARRVVRTVLTDAEAVDVRVGDASWVRRDCCAAALYCVIGRISADQVAGLASIRRPSPRLARAVCEVYYMLGGGSSGSSGEDDEEPDEALGRLETPGMFAPVTVRRVRLTLTPLMTVDGGVAVRAELRAVGESSEPGHPSYGPVQARKLVRALAKAAAEAGPRPWSVSPWMEGTRAIPLGWHEQVRSCPPTPLGHPSCSCGAFGSTGKAAWAWLRSRPVRNAQAFGDAVVESWFVSSNGPDRVRAAMLGRFVDGSDGRDAAFHAAVERNGKGLDLLRRLLPYRVLAGPLGELPDVLSPEDRADAVFCILRSLGSG